VALTLLLGAGARPAVAVGQLAEGAKRPVAFVTANGIRLQAGGVLPIFRFAAPTVSDATVTGLGRLFSSVQSTNVGTDQYQGLLRYTIPNTDTRTILEQYGATGGFNLYNASEAFSETVRSQAMFDETQARINACRFLLNNSLMPSGVTVPGASVQCDPGSGWDTLYRTTEAWSATTDTNNNFSQTQVGLIVQVPMSIPTGRYSQIPSVPLGGPGGHISLMFRDNNPNSTGFTLEEGIPGLSAAALPFYGRSFSLLRTVPAVDPAAVQGALTLALRDAYPGATITMTTPALEFWVSDAGTPQKTLEPKLTFSGIEVNDNGRSFFLRDIVLPAVETGPGGFGPDVTITTPTGGTLFTPGASLAFSASLSGGTAPYTYTWKLSDGTPLGTGSVPTTTQPVTLNTNQLPAVSHDGSPAAVTVVLDVEDGDGALRTASVTVNPRVAPSLYLPSLQQSGRQLATLAASLEQPAVSAQDFIGYTYGIEEASDYPPYGPGGSDLGGVPPDVNGFRSGMNAAGWGRVFHWANASAWEKDWRDCSLGGGDCSYGVDRVDFVYFSGHGGAGGISMPSNRDSGWFAAENARFQTARWIAFSSCQTLRVQGFAAPSEPIRRWFNSFRGSHMLLGFNSNMADIAFGGPLMDNMRMPTFLGLPFPWAQRTIREAWVQTAFNMNAGKPAYIYAVGTNGANPVNDRLPSPFFPQPVFRPFPVASWHWVWWNE
jgi:hypothetical protein